MKYIITNDMGLLAQQLFEAGFTGQITFSANGCTGTVAAFGEPFIAMEITGFCKETLFIAWNTEKEEYVLIGRYNVLETHSDIPDIESLTSLAWNMYRQYKVSKNWHRPTEWDSLFKKFDYITTKMVEEVVERDD